jgi:hypothetical protein
MPSSSRFNPTVKVIDIPKQNLMLMADVVTQQMACYWDDKP